MVLLIACANLANPRTLAHDGAAARDGTGVPRSALDAGGSCGNCSPSRWCSPSPEVRSASRLPSWRRGRCWRSIPTRCRRCSPAESMREFWCSASCCRSPLVSCSASCRRSTQRAPTLHHALKEGGRGGERRPRRRARASHARRGAGRIGGHAARRRRSADPELRRAHARAARLRSGPRVDGTAAHERRFATTPRRPSIASTTACLATSRGRRASSPVGAASILPTRGSVNTTLRVEGEPVDEARLPDLGYVSVRGDYFRAMRIPLIAGREYDASDVPDGPKTAIINETAARRFFPKGDAIGRRIRIGPNPKGQPMQIVGIVGDVHGEAARRPRQSHAVRQSPPGIVGAHPVGGHPTSGDPYAVAPALERARRAADPALAARNMKSLNEVLASSLAPRRFALGLASCFAALAPRAGGGRDLRRARLHGHPREPVNSACGSRSAPPGRAC